MFRISLPILLFLAVNFQLFSQNYSIKGSVKDAETKEPLPFVNISIDNSKKGSISSIDGIFKIESNSQVHELSFSFIGYENVVIPINTNNPNNLNVFLKRKSYEISEVVITPHENPANRIIQKVIENRDRNNPEKMHSFSFTAYNKMFFTVTEDTLAKVDRLPLLIDSLVKDSSEIRLKKFIDKQHFFLCEFVSDRYFKHPDKSYEKVISSKVSGLSDPTFVLLATQMQSFSIYNEYLTLLDKRYINPISTGSISRYSFLLEDTFYNDNQDSIFVISYKPRKGKNFEGLKGVLYVNSNGYAIQNVIAYPSAIDNSFAIRIQQQYEWIDNKQWFPTQLNTDLLFRNIKIKTNTREHFMTAIGKSYLTNIKIDPDVSEINFSNIELDIKPEASKQDENFWKKNRIVPLSKKDSVTYHIVDSVGKAEHMDEKMLLLEAMLYGYVPIGGLNVDIQRFINYNEFEGLKLGLGLATNPKIFSFASIGGFFTYGIKDENWKYSGFIQLFPKWYSDTKLTLRYANNVTETGGISFIDEYTLNSTEFIRNYYISRMDKALEKELSVTFRAFQYLKLHVYFRQTDKIFDNYSYLSPITNEIINKLSFTETGIQVKFAFGEKFIKTPGGHKISAGTKYPVLWLNYKRGLNTLGGEVNYTKYEAKFSQSFFTKALGKTQLAVKAGKATGNLPISDLYDAQGCFEQFSLDAENNFATIKPLEFYSKEFASVFLRQNLGSLIFKGKFFKPEIHLVTNFGWGKLPNASLHLGITFKTMEKGYFESGILFNRLVQLKIIGLGLGAYYRYGNYAYLKQINNFAFKMTLSYNF